MKEFKDFVNEIKMKRMKKGKKILKSGTFKKAGEFRRKEKLTDDVLKNMHIQTITKMLINDANMAERIWEIIKKYFDKDLKRTHLGLIISDSKNKKVVEAAKKLFDFA